jgi:hypothetical protein
MSDSTTDRTFAEVRPLFNAWAVETCVTPIEWAFRYAGIAIEYIDGLTQPYGFASDTIGVALAILPAQLRDASPADRAEALRVCVRLWEDYQQYRSAARIWNGLGAWVEQHEWAA